VKQFLRKLFGGHRKAKPTTGQPRSVQLGVECLDDRLLPSVTAFGAGFVAPGNPVAGWSPDGNVGQFAVVWGHAFNSANVATRPA
jgi:hypothetical protein